MSSKNVPSVSPESEAIPSSSSFSVSVFGSADLSAFSVRIVAEFAMLQQWGVSLRVVSMYILLGNGYSL